LILQRGYYKSGYGYRGNSKIQDLAVREVIVIMGIGAGYYLLVMRNKK
jgi:hypothetical protein